MDSKRTYKITHTCKFHKDMAELSLNHKINSKWNQKKGKAIKNLCQSQEIAILMKRITWILMNKKMF